MANVQPFVHTPIPLSGDTQNLAAAVEREFRRLETSVGSLVAQASGYDLTAAESTAGVTPTNYAYAPLDARRYGFSTSNSAAVNATDLRTAISVASVYGGVVTLPEGVYSCGSASDVIDIPQYVYVRGAGMRATRLNSANNGGSDALFRLGGAKSNASKYGIGLSDLAIVLSDVDGQAVRLLETVGARVKQLYLEGQINAARTVTGVLIDGGDASSYFNVLENILCNHMHIGFDVMTSGAQGPTQTYFAGCSSLGDVATDTTSIGLQIRSGCGSGSMWSGGNFEACKQGIRYASGCQSMSVHGARFEGNTKDVRLDATAGAQTHVGCFIDVDNKIDDASNVNYHRFIACVNGSNLPAGDQEPGQMLKRAVVTGQAPLILEGYPGDTTTEVLIIRDSSGNKLFSVSNQGKFIRVSNAGPASITGSRAGNAALASLLSALNGYGFVVDNTTA